MRSAAVAALADRLGLTGAFSAALVGRTRRRGAVDDGRVLRDLVVMLVGGGDCVSGLGALRDQPDLFGRVASASSVVRVLDAVGPTSWKLSATHARGRGGSVPRRIGSRSTSTPR